MEALNAVIASIDRTKTIEEQQAVDAYAEALENAIAALVRKPVPADYQEWKNSWERFRKTYPFIPKRV